MKRTIFLRKNGFTGITPGVKHGQFLSLCDSNIFNQAIFCVRILRIDLKFFDFLMFLNFQFETAHVVCTYSYFLNLDMKKAFKIPTK